MTTLISTRPWVSWSSVFDILAATVGAMKPGRIATRNFSFSVRAGDDGRGEPGVLAGGADRDEREGEAGVLGGLGDLHEVVERPARASAGR